MPQHIVAALALVTLVVLLGGCSTQATNSSLTADPTSNTKFGAAALADAVLMGQPSGANVVYWPYKGAGVIAYLIYRDTALAPIAVVEGSKVYYIDSATPLQNGQFSELTAATISIDQNTGNVTAFQTVPSFDTTGAGASPNPILTQTSLTVTCQRIPLAEGSHTGYSVQSLFVSYNDTGLSGTIGHPDSYSLKLGDKNTVTNRVTLLRPPVLASPVDGFYPQDGNFRCAVVAGGMDYMLELSPSGNFPVSNTVTVPAQLSGGQFAVANLTLTQMYANDILKQTSGGTIFWRFVVKTAGDAAPLALQDPSQSGGVFSPADSFTLPYLPPQ